MTSPANIDVPSLGLALSGGGARGLLHVGVLQALDEHGIRPQCISGTSIGAVVGALYSAGMKPYEMLDLLSGKGFLNLFRLKPSFSGLLEMRYLKSVLDSRLPDTYEELKIPLYVCATNLSKGDEKIFHSGELRSTVVASASIPVVFEPVIINEEKYVDGGVLNNLPASALKGKCDMILGVEVNRGKFTKDLKTMKNVALEVFHLVVNKNSFEGMGLCDFVIRPELEASFDVFDFSKALKLFEKGYGYGMEWVKGHKNDLMNRKLTSQ